MSEKPICPICKRPLPEGVERARFRPFCSKRCADIDLGRWLKGGYAIPAVESDEETEREAGEGEEEWGAGGSGPVKH